MMSSSKKALALDLWRRGDLLEAGRILFESIPPDKQPSWAARALKLGILKCAMSSPEIDEVLNVASEPSRWSQAHSAFGAVRRMVLKIDEKRSRTRVDEIMLRLALLAELVAKVTYNATSPDDEFDLDSGWRVARRLHSVARFLEDPEIVEAARSALFDEIN